MRYVVTFSRDFEHPLTGHLYAKGEKLVEGLMPPVRRHHRGFKAALYRYYNALAYPVEIRVYRERWS